MEIQAETTQIITKYEVTSERVNKIQVAFYWLRSNKVAAEREEVNFGRLYFQSID